MSLRILRRAALVASGTALVGTLAGCYSGPNPAIGPVPTTPIIEMGQAGYTPFLEDKMTLLPADVISVSVFRENDLSLGSVPVAASGDISFPLIGSLQVAGLTPAELEAQMEQLLGAQYLRNPSVTVNVVEYGSHRITVEGSVNGQGMYTFAPGTRLSGGIALAGGFSRVGDEENVAIFRDTPEGISVAKFDYLAIQNGEAMDPILQPNDRIVVGLDTLAQAWQDFLQLLGPAGFFYRFVD